MRAWLLLMALLCAPLVFAFDLNVAFHYGESPPLDQLRVFDVVVVDPDHAVDPNAYRQRSQGASELYAYVSIGEVLESRKYFAALPADLLRGRNHAWGGRLIDQSHPQWPELFVERIIAPLWQAGYRGFFLDTMDSYQLIADSDAARTAQQDGQVRAIEALKRRFPDARLILNRGFEVLPRIAKLVHAVAAESLVGSWDPARKVYGQVAGADHDWLLAQLRRVRDEWGLQPIAIEYADPRKRAAMRDIASQVLQSGITPYVVDGDLASMGIGALEPVPRRILLLHDGSIAGEEHNSPAQRLIAMPLQYLGYRVDLLDIRDQPLPAGLLADRYAAAVGWFASANAGIRAGLAPWIGQALEQGLKMVFFNSFGVPLDGKLSKRLGVRTPAGKLAPPLAIRERDPMIGFEFEPSPNRSDAYPIVADAPAVSLLKIADARGQAIDGAAITPWGGFVTSPFTVIELPGTVATRWVIHPIEFLRRALGNASMPVPDPSTESGRRLLMVHVDGDAFASRAEVPGSPFASEVMLTDFIERYRVPHTISIIEGEIAANGLYPALSRELEAIARRVFAQPNVEIATHSLSHPFNWHAVMEGRSDQRYNLAVPGYQFDLKREVAGSAGYIDSSLAPPGKKTVVFLWTGDCVPPADAVAATYRAGLLNMNGGDTVITRRDPTLTQVAALSLRKRGWLQVFAPNQNENLYTNNWTGPYYGFEKVIETFELTERPLRLKPIDIYYHVFAAGKAASIASLHKIYQFALSQNVTPVYASDYIRKVMDFEEIALARDLRSPQRWKIAGDGQLRTVRWPADLANRIDWAASSGVAGAQPGRDGHYVHLAAASAWLQAGPAVAAATAAGRTTAAAPNMPYVLNANGMLSDLSRTPSSLSLRFRSEVAGELHLAHSANCQIAINGRAAAGKPVKSSESTLKSAANVFIYQLPEASSRDGVLVSVRC